MEYKVVSSGSNGNCVIIENIMIDCGVSFKEIKQDLYNIKYLLLTHIHSDHIKRQTFEQILGKFPRIQVIGNYEVQQHFHVNTIANAGFEIETEDYIFYPFECVHDVLTYGYAWNIGDKRIIYATDTASLKNAPGGEYDYFFIESNHDEAKLEATRGQNSWGYDPYLSGKRHLSTQQAKAFYYMHRRNAEAELIELHKSKRFY